MNNEQILQACTVEGAVVKLPDVQLDRKAYLEVKKSFELIGGKWKGGKTSGFIFSTDPTELLSQIAFGEKRDLKKEFQFFATPVELANKLVALAEIEDTDDVLEPSAGQGAIIQAINNNSRAVPKCYELMEQNRLILSKSGLNFDLIGTDFLGHKGQKYDKIIANPPFTKNQDIEHLQKMYEFLKPGGKLVCVTSESWENGTQKKQVEFKNWLKNVGAKIINLEKGTFKASGTMVAAKIVVINKHRTA